MRIDVVDVKRVKIGLIAGLILAKGQVLILEGILELLLTAELVEGLSLHGGRLDIAL